MKTLLLISLVVLTGCGSLIPTEHKEQVAVKTAGELAASHSQNFAKSVEDAPPPVSITVPGSDNKLDLRIEGSDRKVTATANDSQRSQGKDSAVGSTQISIPLGVKLLLLAAGLAALVGVFLLIRKQSKAVDAAWQYGDGVLARLIASKELAARTSTDPTELSRLNAELVELEKERGKLNAE